ncbi:HAD family hydrolase [Streptomyces sp. NPDC017405]|uniref:HAD family hydrolase n=1 Tax=unclassified Streptomyces TaxID=2593676 RepID=UPI0037B7A364
MIGDSVTDVEAAQAAGGHSIGFANRALGDAGADVVIATMTAVAQALDRVPA